jgi:hypothetical protein
MLFFLSSNVLGSKNSKIWYTSYYKNGLLLGNWNYEGSPCAIVMVLCCTQKYFRSGKKCFQKWENVSLTVCKVRSSFPYCLKDFPCSFKGDGLMATHGTVYVSKSYLSFGPSFFFVLSIYPIHTHFTEPNKKGCTVADCEIHRAQRTRNHRSVFVDSIFLFLQFGIFLTFKS